MKRFNAVHPKSTNVNAAIILFIMGCSIAESGAAGLFKKETNGSLKAHEG